MLTKPRAERTRFSYEVLGPKLVYTVNLSHTYPQEQGLFGRRKRSRMDLKAGT